MEAKWEKFIVIAIWIGSLATTSMVMTGCDLSESQILDPSARSMISARPEISQSYFSGVLSMDVPVDNHFGTAGPPE